MLFYTYYSPEYDDYKCEFKQLTGVYIDIRYVSDPSLLNYKPDRDEWYTTGSNHRVINGNIARDFEREFYAIELDSLQDLIDFQNKYYVNAGISSGSNYIYNGEFLNNFHYDYMME